MIFWHGIYDSLGKWLFYSAIIQNYLILYSIFNTNAIPKRITRLNDTEQQGQNDTHFLKQQCKARIRMTTAVQ